MANAAQCFLIDDDRDDHELFSMVLQAFSPPVLCTVAKDGIEALQLLQEDRSYVPEFIFIDVNMPKVGGLQCLAAIKKLGHLRSTKIYMLSTSADPKIVQESKDLGAIDFIVKPSRLDELEETLSAILKSIV